MIMTKYTIIQAIRGTRKCHGGLSHKDNTWDKNKMAGDSKFNKSFQDQNKTQKTERQQEVERSANSFFENQRRSYKKRVRRNLKK